MKKYIALIFFSLIAIAGLSQVPTSVSALRLVGSDSTSGPMTVNGTMRFNPVSGKFRFRQGGTWIGLGGSGSGWPLNGSASLTGNVDINTSGYNFIMTDDTDSSLVSFQSSIFDISPTQRFSIFGGNGSGDELSYASPIGFIDIGGDLGDINVTNGPIMTIENSAVTFAKMQNLSASTIIGRRVGSSGAPEQLTVANGLTATSSTIDWDGALTKDAIFTGTGREVNFTHSPSTNFAAMSIEKGLNIGTRSGQTAPNIHVSQAGLIVGTNNSAGLTGSMVAGDHITINGNNSTTIGEYVDNLSGGSSFAGGAGIPGKTIQVAGVFAATKGIFAWGRNVTGGRQMHIDDMYDAILSGTGNQIYDSTAAPSPENSALIGGYENRIISATNSAVIGGNHITLFGTANDNTVAVPNLYLPLGGKLKLKEGTNGTMGTSTLVGGTVVVSTTAVTANSRIMLTHQNTSGTVGFVIVSARTAATSFTILSSSATDTSAIGWVILEPAP